MSTNYKLIDKSTMQCVLTESGSLCHICYEYLSYIFKEMKILNKYNVRVNTLNCDNVYVLELCNQTDIVDVIKYNLVTKKFINENNVPINNIMSSKSIQRRINQIYVLSGLLVGPNIYTPKVSTKSKFITPVTTTKNNFVINSKILSKTSNKETKNDMDNLLDSDELEKVMIELMKKKEEKEREVKEMKKHIKKKFVIPVYTKEMEESDEIMNENRFKNINTRRLEEKKNIFICDIDVYKRIKAELINREILEVPELFSKKFPIYVELEKQNKLMESSYNEYIQMYKERYGDDNKYMNLTKTMAKLNSDEIMPIDYMDNTELVKTILEEHDVKHKVVYNDVDDELMNIEFDK